MPLGALLGGSLDLMERAGIDVAVLRDPGRKLALTAPDGTVFITTRPSDVPTYVEAGAADIGIVGRDVLVERDDIVVSNWTLTGTHTGAPFFGVPPSGKKVTINGTAILRFKDGKIVEHWGGPHCPRGIGIL